MAKPPEIIKGKVVMYCGYCEKELKIGDKVFDSPFGYIHDSCMEEMKKEMLENEDWGGYEFLGDIPIVLTPKIFMNHRENAILTTERKRAFKRGYKEAEKAYQAKIDDIFKKIESRRK